MRIQIEETGVLGQIFLDGILTELKKDACLYSTEDGEFSAVPVEAIDRLLAQVKASPDSGYEGIDKALEELRK